MKTFTHYFSLVMMAFVLLLPVQANEAINAFQSVLTTADEQSLVNVSPDPANGPLEVLPEQVVMTFGQDISNASEAAVIVGMGDFVEIDPSNVNLDGCVVTVNLPLDKMGGAEYFQVSLRVDDMNGEALTVGDFMGYVTIGYDMATSPNSYKCTQVTPAVGEVQELREFVLKFVDEGAFGGDGVIGGVDTTKQVCLYDEYFTLVATGEIFVDYENFASEAKITLNKAIVGDGVYSLVVPEGTFYNEGFTPTEADFGVANFGAIYNPELTFDYTVKAIPTVSVNPDPAAGRLDSVPTELVFTFENEVKTIEEAAVNLGSGYSIPVDSTKIAINGKVVTVQLPAAEMEGFLGFVFVMVVTDVNGNKVTFGSDEGCVRAEYDFAVAANTFLCSAITPGEGEVPQLEKFVLTFDGSEMVGGLDESKQVVVMNQMGAEVAKGVPTLSWDDMHIVEVTLDKKITEPGTYFLVVPETTVFDVNYNAMEEDFGVDALGATYNPELRYMYVVTGAEEVKNMLTLESVNPAEGIVESLDKFDITLANDKDKGDFVGGLDETKMAVLKNEAGESVAKGTISFDEEAWNFVCTVTLDKVVSEKGTYTLVVPRAAVFNSAFDSHAEDFGLSNATLCNDEIVLTYTIGEVTGVDCVVNGREDLKVYTISGVYVGDSLNQLPKGVYVVNGKKLIVK